MCKYDRVNVDWCVHAQKFSNNSNHARLGQAGRASDSFHRSKGLGKSGYSANQKSQYLVRFLIYGAWQNLIKPRLQTGGVVMIFGWASDFQNFPKSLHGSWANFWLWRRVWCLTGRAFIRTGDLGGRISGQSFRVVDYAANVNKRIEIEDTFDTLECPVSGKRTFWLIYWTWTEDYKQTVGNYWNWICREKELLVSQSWWRYEIYQKGSRIKSSKNRKQETWHGMTERPIFHVANFAECLSKPEIKLLLSTRGWKNCCLHALIPISQARIWRKNWFGMMKNREFHRKLQLPMNWLA